MKIKKQNLYEFSTIRTECTTDNFCSPSTIDELEMAINYKSKHGLSLVLLGNGSNILFSKSHYSDILFVKLGGDFEKVEFNDSSITIGAGCLLRVVGRQLIKLGYEDYVFFNLIPGSIGGAITQNAGTGSKEEIKDVCLKVSLYDVLTKKVVFLTNEECLFEYRNSIIKKIPDRYIVLSADFNLSNRVSDIDSLISTTKNRILEKKTREPSGYSFGSTYMNAEIPAWECVQKVKGKSTNSRNIFFSNKHNNWIVNSGSTAGSEISDLILETKKLVKENLDINLKTEVKII